MDREFAIESVERLHEAQTAFYAGGPAAPLRELLTNDVVWRVPGENAIAGVYIGIQAVMEYFARRRDIAAGSLRMHAGELLVGEGEHAAMLTDGTAVLHGAEQKWSTLGLYRFRHNRIAACWLLPLDPGRFDGIWASHRRSSAAPSSTSTPAWSEGQTPRTGL
jgi:ketosteroid isomerase-like protein